MAELRHTVPEELDGERADRILFEELGEEWSRSEIQRWFSEGLVKWRNGKKLRKGTSLSSGEVIEIDEIPLKPESILQPEPIPLSILYEDEELLVIDKPKGLVVHPGSGVISGTLANALLDHCRENLSSLNGPLRPGIVHRLDRDTSGVMVAAKTDTAHRSLAQQLQERTFRRIYRAIAWGNPDEDRGVIEKKIGRDPQNRLKMAITSDGREARTHFHIAERWGDLAEWELQLETGRTHQIRVHLASMRHPVLGDTTYGGGVERIDQLMPMERQLLKPLLKICTTQALQAVEIGFIHPKTGEEMRFTAPPHPELEKARSFLRDAVERFYPARPEELEFDEEQSKEAEE